jgi:diacylglycerol kinase family enzyme
MKIRWKRLRQLLGTRADFQASRAPGHAEELAYDGARAGYAAVVAAGGDGTVHEVANGILRSGASQADFGVIPLGSGNDYAASLGVPVDVDRGCAALLVGRGRRVDVGRVADGRGHRRFFVNTLGLGLSGAVACEARAIHGLRGLPLYGLAALKAIWRRFCAPLTVLTIDGARQEVPTLYFSIALGQREGGGFVIAPEASLDDGWFDYLHAGRMTRLKAVSYLPRLALGWLPDNDPLIRRGRCQKVVFVSERPTPVHLDGELFARLDDDVRELHIEILPGALGVRGSQNHED